MRSLLSKFLKSILKSHGNDAVAWLSSSRVKLGIFAVGMAWVLCDRQRLAMVIFGVVMVLIYADSARPFRAKVKDWF